MDAGILTLALTFGLRNIAKVMIRDSDERERFTSERE